MYILFKHYGLNRYFKRFSSLEELLTEVEKGFNPRFPGNSQFYFNVETKEVVILNKKLTLEDCNKELMHSKVYKEKQFTGYSLRI